MFPKIKSILDQNTVDNNSVSVGKGFVTDLPEMLHPGQPIKIDWMIHFESNRPVLKQLTQTFEQQLQCRSGAISDVGASRDFDSISNISFPANEDILIIKEPLNFVVCKFKVQAEALKVLNRDKVQAKFMEDINIAEVKDMVEWHAVSMANKKLGPIIYKNTNFYEAVFKFFESFDFLIANSILNSLIEFSKYNELLMSLVLDNKICLVLGAKLFTKVYFNLHTVGGFNTFLNEIKIIANKNDLSRFAKLTNACKVVLAPLSNFSKTEYFLLVLTTASLSSTIISRMFPGGAPTPTPAVIDKYAIENLTLKAIVDTAKGAVGKIAFHSSDLGLSAARGYLAAWFKSMGLSGQDLASTLNELREHLKQASKK